MTAITIGPHFVHVRQAGSNERSSGKRNQAMPQTVHPFKCRPFFSNLSKTSITFMSRVPSFRSLYDPGLPGGRSHTGDESTTS
jgi:hypothetical protein